MDEGKEKFIEYLRIKALELERFDVNEEYIKDVCSEIISETNRFYKITKDLL